MRPIGCSGRARGKSGLVPAIGAAGDPPDVNVSTSGVVIALHVEVAPARPCATGQTHSTIIETRRRDARRGGTGSRGGRGGGERGDDARRRPEREPQEKGTKGHGEGTRGRKSVDWGKSV